MALRNVVAVTGKNDDRVTLYDVTNPAAIVELGSVTHADLNTVQALVKVGDNALLASNDDEGKVVLIDITDREAPVYKATIQDLNYSDIRHMITDGTRAYATARNDDYLAVLVPDLVTPQITELGSYDGGVSGGLDGPAQMCFSASGRYLYVAVIDDGGVDVIDLDDPSSPVRVGSFLIAGSSVTTGVCRVGTTLFVVSQGNDTVYAVDVSTEDAPDTGSPLSSVTHADLNTCRYAQPSAAGGHIYVTPSILLTGDFVVIDVSSPAAIARVGSVALPSDGGMHAVGVDDLVFVPCGNDDSLQAIDASNPAGPFIAGEVVDDTRLEHAYTAIFFEDSDAPPDTPTIEDVDPTPFSVNVAGSPYSQPDGANHTDTEIQVDEAGGDFSSPVSTFSGTPTEGGVVEGLTPATDYIVRMRYRTAGGTWSAWSATVAFTTTAAVQPAQPSLSLLSVDDDEATLESSVYSHPTGIELGFVRWQVDEAGGDFSTPVSDVETLAEVHPPWTQLFTGLTAETSYIARVRHESVEGVESDWSGELPFATTSEPGAERPAKPTASVESFTYNDACFTSSAYSSPVGSSHASSEWAILVDPAVPDAILWRYESVSELEAWCTAPLNSGRLQPGYEHGVKVRHKDAAGRWSTWSDPVAFTTLSFVKPPPWITPQGLGLACDAVVELEWDGSGFPGGTTYDLELSTDFGETWTRLVTATSATTYNFDTTGLSVGFGKFFRVRATQLAGGTGQWSYLSTGTICGAGVTKVAPFDIDEWEQLWDIHRTVWSHEIVDRSRLEAREPGDTIGTFPTRWNDFGFLYHPDFGQPIDCDIEVSLWQECTALYTWYVWKCLQQRNQPMGVGILGTGERVPYPDPPQVDRAFEGLTGIFAYFEIESVWNTSLLPPHGFIGNTPIWDWRNQNLGCEDPIRRRKLGWGPPKLTLQVFDGTISGFQRFTYHWPEGVEAPVSDGPGDPTWICNGRPRYGMRLAVRTLNVRENGNRDLRVRIAMTGPIYHRDGTPYGDGRWFVNQVIENVPIVCGWPGLVSSHQYAPTFGRSSHYYDSITVIPYDFADCEPAEVEVVEPLLPTTPGLCPDPEPVTNPALYFGRYFDEDSAGFTTPADIVLYSKSALDVDVPIPCTVTTREVAPRTTVGDNLFRNVWLVIGGQSSGVVIVTPIVDGELKTECARTFIVDWDPENPTPPFLRRYEIALYESIEGESYLGKRGLRGTHFKLKVEVQRTWDCGQLFLHGFDLGWLPATERHNDVVEVEEPWIKTEPYDTGHLFFGSYFEEDSAGFTEEARLLEYGGNPEQESEFFQDDDGVAIPRRIKSREIAPYEASGEAIFRNVYLEILRYNTAALTINVIPVVNDVEHDPIAVVLPGVSKPMLDVREVSLAQDVLVDNVVVGRRALRGTWFRLELDIDDLPAGLVYVESRGVQHSPATESEVNVP